MYMDPKRHESETKCNDNHIFLMSNEWDIEDLTQMGHG